MKTTLPLVTALTLTLPGVTQAEQHHHQHHAGPAAPIGVMANHVHPEGEWMLSYSFMQMQMDGNRTDTDRVSTPLPGNMVSPLSMDMEMHMLGAMMGYSETVTLMAMVAVKSLSMDHIVNMSGVPFNTEASGLGDIKLSALMQTTDSWITNIGLSLPTGSIDEKDVTPMSPATPVQLPYPMQLGSGSYELIVGATYSDGELKNSWGAQATANIPLNDNDRDYRLGNLFEITGWFSYGMNEKNSASVRFKLQDWGNISGADSALNPAMVPTADAKLRAGTRLDLLAGYNYQINKETLIGIEIGAPVYQKLDGPQLETDLSIQLGFQYAL